MKRKYSALSLVLACAAGALVTLLAGALFFHLTFGGRGMYDEAMKYTAVRRIVEEQYIGELEASELSDTVFDTMLAATGDRWSYYMDAATYRQYIEYSENRYVGIGVTIQKDEESGGLLVVSITAGGPAEQAGIRSGHIILAIDGISLEDKSTGDARDMIQERFESELVLSILYEDGTQADVTVSSEVVFKDPVSFELLEGGVGYISISNFETGSAEGAISAVDELIGQGASSLVFDVRNNPGGKLSQLLELLDYLLPEGDIFVSVDKDGNEQVETSGPECIKLPMAVLINANSYSAAEFFAAALSEYGWATTVGEQSTGKSRSQVTFELKDGSAVHLSTKAYLTPNRVDLTEAGGLTPDIELPLSDENDTQLEAAVNCLRGELEANKVG